MAQLLDPNQIDPIDATGGTVADGTYSLAVAGGIIEGLIPSPAGTAPTTAFVPLTTTTGGTPDLVWDANDELVLTEVTL